MQIPGEWYSIDFHVHSPASRCFEGPKAEDEDNDEAYFWLLKQAKEADLDIIVVTDHNTISGYERFLALRAELESTRRTLLRNDVAIPDKIQRQVELFDQITILPGIELDADPNIHLLVLFDPQTSPGSMDDFLTRGGYPEDIRGDESVARHAKWSVRDVCREASTLGAVVIAAHVDSDKGLYEASRHWGQKRIAAFTDENLFAMEFINPKTRDQIQSILKQPAYARDTHLSFVQSSDFHGRKTQQIGERRTYVRLDDVKDTQSDLFRALKRALRNPVEYVSAPGRPEIREIQTSLEDSPCIEALESDSDLAKLHQFVCAFSNSEDGTIVIGRNDRGNWTGIRCSDTGDATRRIAAMVHDGVKPPPRVEVELYPYYSDRFFATVRVHAEDRIRSTVGDDRVYSMVSGQPKKASTDKVVHLAENKLLERYEHLSITRRLRQISRELEGTRDSLDVLPLVRKIEAQTRPFSHLFAPPATGAVLEPGWEDRIEFAGNGLIEGEVVLLEPTQPRLRDQYIRITAPLARADLDDPALHSVPRFDGPKIVLAPGGAVYLDSRDGVTVMCRQVAPLVCQAGDDYTGPDLAFVVAYLKSAVAIWYADRCLGSTDFRDTYRVLRKVPIPHQPPVRDREHVLDLVSNVIQLERDFLADEQVALGRIKSLKENSQDADAEALTSKLLQDRMIAIEEHNEEATALMSKIEHAFFELLALTEEEVEIVQQGVRGKNFAVFS